MPELPRRAPMPVPFRCTTDDYREASAANGVWAKLEGRHNPLPNVITKVSGAAIAIGIAVAAVLMPYGEHPHATWRVAPLALIVPSLLLPSLCLVIILQTLAKLWKRQRTPRNQIGIVQEVVPRSIEGISGAKAARAISAWIMIFALLGVLYLLSRMAPPSRVPSARPAPTGSVNGEPAGPELPFVAILCLTLAPSLVMLLLSAVLARRLQIQQYTQGQPQLFDPKSLEFNEAGVVITSETTENRLRWPAIIKFAESEHLFLLYISEIMFHMVPKRAMAEAGQLEAFVAALTTHVPRGVLLPRPAGGFPVQPIPVIALPPPLPGER
jgi:YcxB-like protein